MPDDNNATAAAALAEIGAVRGQLGAIMSMIQQGHAEIHRRIDDSTKATNQRIDDFRGATEKRFSGIEARIEVLEGNERSTALRVAGVGGISGAVFAAGVELLKHFKP